MEEYSIELNYNLEVDENDVTSFVAKVKEEVPSYSNNKQVLTACFNAIDLTTLNATDGFERGELFAQRVNEFPQKYPNLGNVAAICVYPALVPAVRETLEAEGVSVASVAAGFPSSQTFIDIKLSECQMAMEMGADELDVVISLGSYLEGDLFSVFSELQQMVEAADEAAHVKVILETGALPSLKDVRIASFLAMEAGAHFIKTSTGKMEPAATLEAVYVMCKAIKEYHEQTGRMVGIKPAGGVVTPEDAIGYYLIVKHVLGDKWLTPEWFRLGASRLANNLVARITGAEVNYF
ncbi:MAG: deoxyribose-phosphate aldolase [Bacteroidales bacterium]|nr:deoxyribose-phosphate aldolase [Bacteroidales bacterium]MBN2748296.1 deoxyribose-phosphate aldolase [Bacteroidales bacterium]